MNSDYLLQIIESNNVEELAELVKGNPNKNATYSIGQKKIPYLSTDNLTLLHIAAYYNATECLIYLHSICNMSIFTKGVGGFLPFHYACVGGASECAYIILGIMEDKDKNEVKTLFEKDYADEKFSSFNLPFLATLGSSKDILLLLFGKGYDFERYQNLQKHNMNKAIEYAIKTKNVDLVEILLRYLKPSKNSSDNTPLMLAVMNNQTAAIPLLLKTKCEPGAKTKDNKTALSYACLNGNIEAAIMIANVLVDPDIPSNIAAPSAVHWICQAHDPKLAEIVLSKGINVNRLDDLNCTGPSKMLDLGDEDEIIQMLELLLKHGFDINKHAQGKNTILGDFLLAIKKRYKIIEWLLLHGADTSCPIGTNKLKPKPIGDQMREMASCNKIMQRLVKEHLDSKDQQHND